MNPTVLESFFLVLTYIVLLCINSEAASIHRDGLSNTKNKRYRRGLLSRTGVCPQMDSNLQRKDNRLNFFGQAIVFPGEEVADCFTSDCTFDGDCEGDKKCCRNNCGAAVCSPVVRDPHPCQLLQCPEEMVCKIERVHCQMPYCPDIYARSRPTCVQKPGYYARLARKRSRIPQPVLPVAPGPDEVHFIPRDAYKNAPVPFSS